MRCRGGRRLRAWVLSVRSDDGQMVHGVFAHVGSSIECVPALRGRHATDNDLERSQKVLAEWRRVVRGDFGFEMGEVPFHGTASSSGQCTVAAA